MRRYLISYDLVQPHKDYVSLIRHLESDYIASRRPLASVWMISSTLTHAQVRNAIAAFMDKDDKLYVVDITGSASAWRNISESDLLN